MEAERFARTLAQYRASSIQLKQARHTTILLAEPPKAVAPAPRVKTVTKTLCQSRTLEGRPCGFAATCGAFCKKHAPVEPTKPKFKLEGNRALFTDARPQGSLEVAVKRVCDVFGAPNGAKDATLIAEWLIKFGDGTVASACYRRGSKQLQVAGPTANSVELVRKLLL